jgi:superfamily II DNA or RNA helicase
MSGDESLKKGLWASLRYREKDYFMNARYRMKLWDGYKNFFDKDSGKFLTGLLPEVKKFIVESNQTYQTIDERNRIQFGVESVDENWMGNGIKLYDYQVDYINLMIKHKRGTIFAPTSAGKTLMMIGVLKALSENVPTLVLANRTSLVDQHYKEMVRLGIKNVGRFYGKEKQANIITCATVQSCHLLKPLLPKIRCLFVDEIHEMMSRKPKQVYAACKQASVRIAFSATPFKEDDECQKYEVKGFIGPVFKIDNDILTTKELQERGILSKAECIFRPIFKPDLPYHTYIDAVTEGIAGNTEFHEITKRLVDSLDGRILIIVERIEHGDRLLDLMPDALWVRGQDNLETRNVVIEKLKKGTGKVVAIATSGIFNTGLNVFVHHLCNNAGGQAEHQIIQRFGRGLRRADDKEKVVYHDWIFHNNDYLKKHSKKRVRILTKEGHEVKVLDKLDI